MLAVLTGGIIVATHISVGSKKKEFVKKNSLLLQAVHCGRIFKYRADL